MAEITMEVNAKIPFEVVLPHAGDTHMRYQIVELDTEAWGGSLNLVVEHTLDGHHWASIGTLDSTITAAKIRQGAKCVRAVQATRIRNSVPHANAKRLLITIFSDRESS